MWSIEGKSHPPDSGAGYLCWVRSVISGVTKTIDLDYDPAIEPNRYDPRYDYPYSVIERWTIPRTTYLLPSERNALIRAMR